MDISQEMLKQTEAKLSEVKSDDYELKQASASDLPNKDEKFDLLFNTYMFDLIPYAEIEGILQEFHRVLKADGQLVVINMTGGESLVTKTFNRLHSFLYKIAPKLIGGCRPLNLSPYLKEAGFKIINREYQQQLFVPSEVIVARKE